MADIPARQEIHCAVNAVFLISVIITRKTELNSSGFAIFKMY
jgi:hypothetical protein